MKLPLLEGNMSNIYNTTREKVFMEKIIGELGSNSFFEETEVSKCSPELPVKNITLNFKQYGPAAKGELDKRPLVM